MPQGNPNKCCRLLASLACLLSLILTFCQRIGPKSAIGDGGLLSGEPCAAPCFWNVSPGVTTRDQSLQALERYGTSGYRQEGDFIVYDSTISFRYDINGIVDRVSFVPDPPIAVGAVIAKYSEPDAVEVRYDPTSLPEHPMFDMMLYYDALHMTLALERQDAWPAPILGQDISITEVVYLAKDAYELIKKANKHLIEWRGYGLYEDPNPYGEP